MAQTICIALVVLQTSCYISVQSKPRYLSGKDKTQQGTKYTFLKSGSNQVMAWHRYLQVANLPVLSGFHAFVNILEKAD